MIKRSVFLFLLVLVAACDSTAEPPGEARQEGLPPLILEVESTVRPDLDALGERRLTRVVDEDGVALDFVAEELVFVGDEGLEAFIERWSGTLIATADFGALSSNGPRLHRVSVDPLLGDSERVGELFKQVDETIFGEFVVSDDEALGLLAIAAEERAMHGNHVMINPYLPAQGDPMAYIDGGIQAAPTGPGTLSQGGTYDPDPRKWVHYNSGSTQDIGVTDAWRALAMAGLSDPDDSADRVRMVVLDGGFLDLDMPPGAFARLYGSPNAAACSSGNECPWHGTAVTQVAVGDPLSGTGAVGVAGLVGTATMIGAPGDLQTALELLASYINEPGPGGFPRIINMSFGGDLHWAWDELFGLTSLIGSIFSDLQALNILAFTSAGNDGKYLHEEVCASVFGAFETCWEKYKTLPCQADGVVCVGGMADDSISHHTSSKHGRGVDIWAPFRVYTSIDPAAVTPDETLSQSYVRGGTSYSSPYVAGVAALVMAADPSLSARDVRDLLISTARTGSGRVTKYVQAYTAVTQALGGAPFTLEFMYPQDGAVYERGDRINMRAQLVGGDFPSTLEWRFDGEPMDVSGGFAHLDGEQTRELAPGTYEISVTATAGPYELTRTREIDIVNSAPTVSIQAPVNQEEYYENSRIVLAASSSDRDSAGGQLSDAQIRWTLASTGQELAVGHLASIEGSELGEGTWTLVVTADDGLETATAEVTITVEEASPLAPPSVAIIKPESPPVGVVPTHGTYEDGHIFYSDIELEAVVIHDGVPLTGSNIVWTSTADRRNNGEVSTLVLGEGASLIGRINNDDAGCATIVEHLIEVTATAPNGVSRTVGVTLLQRGVVC